MDFPNGIPECGADALRFGLLAYTVQVCNATCSYLPTRITWGGILCSMYVFLFFLAFLSGRTKIATLIFHTKGAHVPNRHFFLILHVFFSGVECALCGNHGHRQVDLWTKRELL